ncbi:triosephosphate isomerase [Datura stramonium]|uniref:Triosephosphate isomerase n=1 Tax=Datura stramonium TaxID=4076 RepID=A0ABS8TC10_DATST|nr:triosephosphate isomerase [Datura stramonium]
MSQTHLTWKMPSQVETRRRTICSRNGQEKYTNVDSLALLTRSNTEIAILEGLETPQIGTAKSVEVDLVQEPSSITEAQVFDEISHTTASSGITELNDRFNLQTKQGTMMSNKRMRTAEIEYSIATQVSLLVPIVGREAVMPNEHLEQDMPTRYVVTNSVSSGFPKWKTDLETFTVVDLCVWNPGIGFWFMALTGYIENMEELLLLGCTGKFFLIAYSNSMSRVWDPGQPGKT